MADFLTGNVGSFLQGLPNIGASGQNFMNLYATDSWRINPRLTFNFGLRWEPYLPMVGEKRHSLEFQPIWLPLPGRRGLATKARFS